MSDDKEEFTNWLLPEVGETETEESTENTLFGKPATWYHNEKPKLEEEQDTEEEITPLTLDDIEAIRVSAYEDGFKEGKSAGYEEGQDAGFTEGKQKGHEQGIEEGLLEGKTEIEKQTSQWQALIERLHTPLAKLDDSVEYQLVRLAVSLAEQIARCEVQSNPQIILQALKQAVDALPVSEQTLRILLHPEDLVLVQDAYPQEVCLKRGWDLQAEPALARGDCQIHTSASSVDYAFAHRIEQVLKHFFKENHQQLPDKNDDTNLLNTDPLPIENEQAEPQANVEDDTKISDTPDDSKENNE